MVYISLRKRYLTAFWYKRNIFLLRSLADLLYMHDVRLLLQCVQSVKCEGVYVSMVSSTFCPVCVGVDILAIVKGMLGVIPSSKYSAVQCSVV